jgi:hypothetical protein
MGRSPKCASEIGLGACSAILSKYSEFQDFLKGSASSPVLFCIIMSSQPHLKFEESHLHVERSAAPGTDRDAAV